MLKSFNRLLNVDPGFKSENLLTANLPLVEYKNLQRAADVTREVKSRIAQIPGVTSVGCGSALPPINAQRSTRFAVEGLPSSDGSPRSAYFIGVTPDYFTALGAQLLDGRDFNDRDLLPSAKVVIINRTMARNLFPNESAVGKRLQLINSEHTDEWREIVGVVGDVRYSGLDDSGEAAIYTPFAQTPFMWANLMIRTSLPPLELIRTVRGAIKSVDPALEPVNFRAMEELMTESTSQPRLYTTLLGMFALLALILAAIGIYGVLAHSVTQRRQEIGVRLALGATQGKVLRLILKQGMTLALIGCAIGLLGASALTRVMTSLLFETDARDPLTYVGVALVLLTVALLACWIPSRRAAQVDPMESLRGE
jgi:putative ABC transport system permease protein